MAASSITMNTTHLKQKTLFTISHCKYPNTLKFHFLSKFPKKNPTFIVNSKSPTTKDHEKTSTNTFNSPTVKQNDGGLKGKRADSKTVEALLSSIGRGDNNNKSGRKNLGLKQRREKEAELVKMKKTNNGGVKKDLVKGSKKIESPDFLQVRVNLDMCLKRGDVKGAIEIYETTQRDGIELGQYHYTVFLYLCSSAAVGFVRPNKSGSGNRTLNALDLSGEGDRNSDGTRLDKEITFSEGFKTYVLEKGFEIYKRMCLDNVPMNEATLTAVARMAMSMGNGDMAFDMVKQMKPLGINPRLRSYGPALSTFCSNGDVDKAFAVEMHMLEHSVYPEEPELQALLRVSVEAGKSEKVYYLLHKLRTSVRKVLPSTAEIISNWFENEAGLSVRKTKWDREQIKAAIENGGGGLHGEGWLGKGKWNIVCSVVG